jgi:ABC-type antimicrobial peptide transport system permease subunit
MAATENVKRSIASWLPRASIASPGTMLQLFGGVSQTIGRFGPVAVAVGAAAAIALSAMLVLGVIAERRRELAVLRVLGWHEAQVRRQLAVEMAVQGLLGGLVALALVALGIALMGQVVISLPATLPGENPVNFATGGFQAAKSAVHLPIATTVWDWAGPVIVATLAGGLWGWLWSADRRQQSLWATIKSS